MNLAADQVTNSLRLFKTRRDNVLHEDPSTFHHHVQRFVEFCQNDSLIQSVLMSLQTKSVFDIEEWWNDLRTSGLSTPSDPGAELSYAYAVLESTATNKDRIMQFGVAMGKFKYDEAVELFRSLLIRPFAEELGHRISTAANLATPEERMMQAVPLDRIPRPHETRIFLSHKSADKPLVRRYYNALMEIGFTPWLDEPDMPAGANLERELIKGFEESCAAVFFITEHFADERYLAAEVDYAIQQKRKKDEKFAIVTLRYPNASPVPKLLTPYVYKDVSNDLEGFYQLLRSLPIELNRLLWKTRVVSS